MKFDFKKAIIFLAVILVALGVTYGATLVFSGIGKDGFLSGNRKTAAGSTCTVDFYNWTGDSDHFEKIHQEKYDCDKPIPEGDLNSYAVEFTNSLNVSNTNDNEYRPLGFYKCTSDGDGRMSLSLDRYAPDMKSFTGSLCLDYVDNPSLADPPAGYYTIDLCKVNDGCPISFMVKRGETLTANNITSIVKYLSNGVWRWTSEIDNWSYHYELFPNVIGGKFIGYWINSNLNDSSSSFEHNYNNGFVARSDEFIDGHFSLYMNFNDAVTVKFDKSLYHDNSEISVDEIQTVEYNHHPVEPARPKKNGYAFDYWFIAGTDDEAITFDNSYNFYEDTGIDEITFYAHWTPAVTVKFDIALPSSNVGEIYETQVVRMGSFATKPTDPTKNGYTFDYWYLAGEEDTPIDFNDPTYNFHDVDFDELVIYAHWTKNPAKYTVSYNANGGTGAPSSQTKTQGVTLTLSSTIPTRTGYTFKGWAESSTATTAAYQPGGNYTKDAGTTLYAVWEEETQTYTLTFNANGGSTVSSKTVTNGEKYGSLPVSTKTGQILVGWYLNSNFANDSKIYADKDVDLNGNSTAYAKWVAKKSTTFVGDLDGNNKIDTTDYSMLGRFIAGAYDLTADQINIADVNKDNVVDEKDSTFLKSVLLGEQTLNICVLKFNTYDNNYLTPIKTNCDSKVSKPTNPTRMGYTFNGWYTAATGGTEFDFNSVLTTSKTLYAVWNEIVLKLEDVSGYTVLDNDKVVISPEVKPTELRVSEGYTLVYAKGEGKADSEFVGTADTLTLSKTSDPDTKKTYTVIVNGDSDGDGSITARDYRYIKKHVMETKLLTGVYRIAGDVDKDNDITARDYRKIKKYVMRGEF